MSKHELIVFIRIFMYGLGGYLAGQGHIDAETADQLRSPETVTALAGVLVFIGTLMWYTFSKARALLRNLTS